MYILTIKYQFSSWKEIYNFLHKQSNYFFWMKLWNITSMFRETPTMVSLRNYNDFLQKIFIFIYIVTGNHLGLNWTIFQLLSYLVKILLWVFPLCKLIKTFLYFNTIYWTIFSNEVEIPDIFVWKLYIEEEWQGDSWELTNWYWYISDIDEYRIYIGMQG